MAGPESELGHPQFPEASGQRSMMEPLRRDKWAPDRLGYELYGPFEEMLGGRLRHTTIFKLPLEQLLSPRSLGYHSLKGMGHTTVEDALDTPTVRISNLDQRISHRIRVELNDFFKRLIPTPHGKLAGDVLGTADRPRVPVTVRADQELDLIASVDRALDFVAPAERRILRRRYGLDDGLEHPTVAIAVEEKVQRSTVANMITRGLGQLRSNPAFDHVRPYHLLSSSSAGRVLFGAQRVIDLPEVSGNTDDLELPYRVLRVIGYHRNIRFLLESLHSGFLTEKQAVFLREAILKKVGEEEQLKAKATVNGITVEEQKQRDLMDKLQVLISPYAARGSTVDSIMRHLLERGQTVLGYEPDSLEGRALIAYALSQNDE